MTRGVVVAQMEQLPEVLPTVDPSLGALVHASWPTTGSRCSPGRLSVRSLKHRGGRAGRLRVEARTTAGQDVARAVDMVLVVVGVRPDSELAASAGAALGLRGAIAVDRHMRTNLPVCSPPGTASSPITASSGPATSRRRHYRSQTGPGRRRERPGR